MGEVRDRIQTDPASSCGSGHSKAGTRIWGRACSKKAKIHPLPTCKEPAEACLVGVASRIPDALERSRKATRSGGRQARSPARGTPLSRAGGPSTPTMDGSPGFREYLPDGSQQHCSAGECDCFTIVVPF